LHGYMAIPISITVEGANILTRNLMIFGQGATRCHPYVLAELEAAANPDAEEGLKQFDKLLMKHVGFAVGNTFGALWQGLTAGAFNSAPVSGETAKYYKQLSRMSRGLALSADFSMLILGGELKRREMLSARLGDVLSQLYIASAVLKFYEDNGRQQCDLPFVHYSLQRALFEIGRAFDGFFANFPNRFVAGLLRTLVFPFGIGYKMPADDIAVQICDAMSKPGVVRDRLTHLCYIGEGENDATGLMEGAFVSMYEAQPLMKKIYQAQRSGQLPRKQPLEHTIVQAQDAGIISAEEAQQLNRMNELRFSAISVDSFAAGTLEAMAITPAS
uniref:acyl-CoA dehydrogenase domain-containing protein n=1 Tax=Rheinheimera sp. TaxID=1869214 RepID=UPI0037C6ED15